MPEVEDKTKLWWYIAGVLALLAFAAAGVGAYLVMRLPHVQDGPQQPIPFSHQFHVGTKDISCLMCHIGVRDADRAGVPPLSTCMLCHQSIIPTHPQIVKLREYYAKGQPVQWVRVNQVPDFVYFSHQRHIRAGFDCSRCHGNVAAMDRVKLSQDLKMGFCVQCHRDNNFSNDCLICHR